MNSLNLIGRFARDLELKYTSTNLAVVSSSIAVPKGKDKAIFLNVKAFDKKAENMAKFFTKGMQVGITGHLDVEEWNDKEGKKRTNTVIIVDDFTFAEAKKQHEPEETHSRSQNASMAAQDASESFYTLSDSDELPF